MADWELSTLALAWAGCVSIPGSLVFQMQVVGTFVSAPGRLLGFVRHPAHHQSTQQVVLVQ